MESAEGYSDAGLQATEINDGRKQRKRRQLKVRQRKLEGGVKKQASLE